MHYPKSDLRFDWKHDPFFFRNPPLKRQRFSFRQQSFHAMLWFYDIQAGLCWPLCQRVLIQGPQHTTVLLQKLVTKNTTKDWDVVLGSRLTDYTLHSRCFRNLSLSVCYQACNACVLCKKCFEVKVKVDLGSHSGILLDRQRNIFNTYLFFIAAANGTCFKYWQSLETEWAPISVKHVCSYNTFDILKTSLFSNYFLLLVWTVINYKGLARLNIVVNGWMSGCCPLIRCSWFMPFFFFWLPFTLLTVWEI